MNMKQEAKAKLEGMAENYARFAANADRLANEAAERGDIADINHWVDVREECHAKCRGLKYRAKRLG